MESFMVYEKVHNITNFGGYTAILIVLLSDKYFKKLPADARKADVFYFTPLSFPNDPSKPLYNRSPVSKNQLTIYKAESGKLITKFYRL